MERTVGYLQKQMAQFLRKGDPVLICFDDDGGLGTAFYQAAMRCGAVPRFLGEDRRWIALLRQAFDTRAGTLIAPPLVVLGLAKLARAKGTPLYIRNVLTAGYPCTDWMIQGIRNGLDCKTWGCFDVPQDVMAAGFSCPQARGVHINSDEFEPLILGPDGTVLPDGEFGDLVLRCRESGRLLYTCDRARIAQVPCKCGSDAKLLTDLCLRSRLDPELIALSNSINRWTSVLDCRIEHGPSGLEIEIVVFPGEKLPKLPSCAKLVVRSWDPEKDAPFYVNIQKELLR